MVHSFPVCPSTDRPLVCMNSPVLLSIIRMCSLSSVSVFSDFSSLDCLSKKVHVWISVLVLQTWTVRCVCVLQFLQHYPYSCGSPVCPIELHPSSWRAFTMLGTSAARSLQQILFDLWTAAQQWLWMKEDLKHVIRLTKRKQTSRTRCDAWLHLSSWSSAMSVCTWSPRLPVPVSELLSLWRVWSWPNDLIWIEKQNERQTM